MTDLIEMALRHQKQDTVLRGSFEMEYGKACSIGCFNAELGNEPDDCQAFARDAGIPVWAAHLHERIFENLPSKDGAQFHVDVVTAYAGVTDWVEVYHKTMVAILQITLPHDKGGQVKKIIDMHKRGREVAKNEWAAARAAADAAAAYAAADAAYAAADADADAAAAAYAAAYAADAAAAARAAARTADAAAYYAAAPYAYAAVAAYTAAYTAIRDGFLNAMTE